MDAHVPIIIPSSHLSNGNKAAASLSKSNSGQAAFSDHLDDKVSQLNKGSNNSRHKVPETAENSTVDRSAQPEFSASNKPLEAKNEHQNVGFPGKGERPTIENVLTNNEGVFLPHQMISNGEPGDIAKQLLPEIVVSQDGNSLPLDRINLENPSEPIVASAPIQTDVFEDMGVAEKFAFNPLANIVAERVLPAEIARGALLASEFKIDIAAKVGVNTSTVFQNGAGGLAGIKLDNMPVINLAETEVTSVANKLSELMAAKGSDQTHSVSQLAQQHGELVRDAASLRKDGNSEISMNLSSAHLQVNAEIHSANKPMLSVDSPVNSARWSGDLGKNIQWMMNQSINGAQMRLNPQQLGPIEIRLQMENGQATVAFTAQHAATREAIDAAIPRLREMLIEQDVNLVDVNVSQHSFAEQQQQQSEFSEFSDTAAPAEELAANPDFTGENVASTSLEGLVNEYV
jgi:hypothetical protein